MAITMSDDNAIQRQIEATHKCDERDLEDVKALFKLIKDILSRPTSDENFMADQSHNEDGTNRRDVVFMLEKHSYTIDRISYEIGYRTSSGEDSHSITLSLLNFLNNYEWTSKLLLTLAAFGLNYGESWHLFLDYLSNQGMRPQQSDKLRLLLDAVRTLISAMVDLTGSLVSLKELSKEADKIQNAPAVSTEMVNVPVAIYWTIRIAVACASQITSLTSIGYDYVISSSQEEELSTLKNKLEVMDGNLKNQLDCEACQKLKRLLEIGRTDNIRILNALINDKDYQRPLIDGSTRKKEHVRIDVLRQKFVLLLISDLDIFEFQLSVLIEKYNSRQGTRFEMVWLPIVDPKISEKEIESLIYKWQEKMPWYIVRQPWLIDTYVIKFIMEVWHFEKKAIIVALNEQGEVKCSDALPMILIWGFNLAFPFTRTQEEALWEKEKWGLELLLDNIERRVFNWISERKLVCLYGGEVIEWIEQFTTAAHDVTREANISLEMLYVGKSDLKERVEKDIQLMMKRIHSNRLQDLKSIRQFWVRLQSMGKSKMHLGKTLENDNILQEIVKMLSYDSEVAGWAMFTDASTGQMLILKADKILTSLQEYELWKEHVQPMGFLSALDGHLRNLYAPHHCNRLILPHDVEIQKAVTCSDCGRQMEKHILFSCCTD